MFNWLGNLFPYSDLHSLNLDWILSKMKETASQSMKAVADAANALSQVADAKAAALSAQTAAQDAQTAAGQAAVNAASAAANAVQALNAAQTANTAAENAQNTANSAQIAAQNAKNTADEANTAASEAKTSISDLSSKLPIKSEDIEYQAITADKMADFAVTSDAIADSAVTSKKISDNVIFGFQIDSNSSTVNINSTSTPVSLTAPSFSGKRVAYLTFSTTATGYIFIPEKNILSVDFKKSAVYTYTLGIMKETTMEVTTYIVKYTNNTLTLYTSGTAESQNTVIPLQARVTTYKLIKTT